MMLINSSVKTSPTRGHWAVQTVVVRLSRKLTATYRIRKGRVLSRLLAVMLAGFANLALALPGGVDIVSGQAAVTTPSADTMRIQQASDKAILNWQSFNIGAGQSVQFLQPNAASVALNRVIGANPSSIYGSLSANGQVFLINPAGVMFAPGAQINVGGLVASSLGISNEDFNAGRYTFNGSGGGSVVNHGSIRAARGGYVLLAGAGVANSGSITTEAGSAGLIGGSRVTLDTSGAGLVRFSVDAAAVNAAASNSGTITAAGGQVAMLASALGDAMATVVNQTGVIRATSATERNGLIVLSGGASGVVNVAGKLDASGTSAGQTGGTVKVLGDKVVLASGARIDASGQAGGGTVLVGGNYQGKGPEQNASVTLVAQGAAIDASATGAGDGGKVVVWAEGATGFYGSLRAEGGADAGNGGLAEVSGRQTLAFDGSASLGAAKGAAGTLLLDPLDIVIGATGPASYANVNTFAAQAGTTQNVSVTTLNAVAGNIVLQATNNITLGSALVVSGARSIGLEANNHININAALSVTGGGTISLKADADNSGAGALAIGAALSSQAGGITLSGAGVTSTAAGTISTSGAGNGNAGALSITSTGVVNLSGGITAAGGAAGAGLVGRAGGTVSISGVGGVTAAGISSSGTTGGTGNTAGGDAGSITVSNNGSGDISLGALTARTGAARGTGASSAVAGSINVSNFAAGGNVGTGAISTAGGAGGAGGSVTLVSQAGVTVTGTLNTSGTVLASGTRAGSNAGHVTITGVNRGITGAITASGSAGNGTNQAGGNAGVVSITGTGTLDTAAITASSGNATGTGTGGTAGSITLSGATVGIGGALTTSGGTRGAGGNVSVSSGGALNTGAVAAAFGTGATLRGDVTLLAGGPITQGGAIVTRNLSATTASNGGATITLTHAGNDAQTVSLQVRDGTPDAVGAANTGAAISYTDANAVAVSGINSGTGASGDVTLLAGGAITQSGAIHAAALTATTANATAGAGLITLNHAGNTADSVNLQARAGTVAAVGAANAVSAIQYTGADAVTVAGINSGTGAGGNVTLLAGGAITQNGAIKATTLTATTARNAGSAITLTNTANDAATVNLQVRDGTIAAVGAGNANAAISYTDTNAVGVSGINSGTGTAGDVTLVAGGTVTQSGAIKAGTLAVKTLNDTPAAITLTNAGNDAAIVSLQTRNSTDSERTAAAIAYTDANAMVIAGINNGSGIAATGNLSLSAAGPVTQTGAVIAGGATSIAAGAGNDVTLTNAGNDFGGAVAVATGRNVALNDANALVLGTSAVSGTLGVTTGGAITQTGAVVVTGATTLTAGAGNNITLTNAGNNFASVSVMSGNNVSLRDSNALVLGGSSVSGALSVTAGGAITQTGAITANALTAKTLVNAGAAITLNNASNDVATVDLRARNAADTANASGALSYRDANGFDVAGVSTGGALTLQSNGNITQSGAMTVAGLTTLTAGAGNDITLTHAVNNFGSVGIVSGRDVSLTDSNAMGLAASTVASSLTLNAGGSVTQTGAIVAPVLHANLTGAASALTLSTAGNHIAQLGGISTPGGFSLNNGNNAIAVNGVISTGNTAVSLTSGTGVTSFGTSGAIATGGGNVTLTNSNSAKLLGNIDTTGGAGTGNLTVTGAGVISQQAATTLKVKGTTSIAAGAGNDVTLTNAGNDFGGAVAVTTGRNVALNDANALVLGTSAVSGTLGVTTGGAITQTGAVVVTGATTLTAGAGNNITLTNAGNNFASVSVMSGNNVSLRDSNALVLGGSSVGGALSVTAGGAITQTGAITANALTAKTLVNAGAAITLNNAGNDVATVDLRARNAADTANASGALSYRDANGFDVAGVSTGGALTLQSNGNITQSGAITAASLSVPGTGSGSLRLDTQANNITALNAITAAAGFALNNGNNSVAVNGALTTSNSAVAIDAGTGTYAQANVDINAGTGPITVTADTVNITTNTLNNAMGTSGVLTIKAKSAGRAMSLGAAGAGFDLLTTEITSLSAGATGPIVIGDAASTGVMTIGAAVNLAGKTLTLNAGAITDSGSNVITAANLTLNANGQIGTDGSNGIDVAASKLNVNTTSGGNAFVRSGAISFGVGTEGSSVAGTLDLTATGNVTQTAGTGNIAAGTLKVKTLSAGTATVALTNAGNDVAAVQLQSRNAGDSGDAAGALQYTDTNGFDVVALSTTGDATLSAGGSVTQSGAINAAGLALMGSGGAYTLRHAGNAVTTLAASTGSMDYSQAGALAVGPVAGVPGVTTTGAAKLETTGAASDLTLNQAVTSAATGDAIVLKAGSSNATGVAGGGRFVNHAGTSGLVAASGRYLVYSGDPGTTTEGVTGYSKRYNTGAAFTPAGSASTFLYRVAPTLTITSDNASRTYGQANPIFTGSASGYIDGDTAASVGVTRSTSAVFNTPVAAGPAAITSGATNHENYTLVLGDGLLTIERAPISSVNGITANDKLADGSTQATLNTGGATYAGIVAGDVLTASATGNFDTPSPGAGKLVFVKGITLGGTAADNYTLLQNTAVTRASISELPRTPVVQPLTVAGLSAAARMPLARTGSEGLAVPQPPSVLDANALIEQLPTASGGCQAQGSGCLTVRTVREATVRVPGLMSVTLARGVTGFQFSLPSGLLTSMPASGEPLEVSTLGGRPLPPWLTYDAATGTFTVGTPPAGALPLQIRLGAGNRSVILTIEESPRNVAARQAPAGPPG